MLAYQRNKFGVGIGPEEVGDGSGGLPRISGALLGKTICDKENAETRLKKHETPSPPKTVV